MFCVVFVSFMCVLCPFCLCGMSVLASSVWVLLVCVCVGFVPLHVFCLFVFFVLRCVADAIFVCLNVCLFVCVCSCAVCYVIGFVFCFRVVFDVIVCLVSCCVCCMSVCVSSVWVLLVCCLSVFVPLHVCVVCCCFFVCECVLIN